MTKVLCILPHRGVQLILAYSQARPAILVAGKGRGMFLFMSPPFIMSPPLGLGDILFFRWESVRLSTCLSVCPSHTRVCSIT